MKVKHQLKLSVNAEVSSEVSQVWTCALSSSFKPRRYLRKVLIMFVICEDNGNMLLNQYKMLADDSYESSVTK